MADIKYLYHEWQEQLDALKELFSGWSSIRDLLQAADDNLEDIDRDIDDKDEDRAITSFHSNLRDEIDTLCDSYVKLKNYCERIGDVIKDTVDTPFYSKMDDFTQSMKGLSINNYTTENTLDVTTTTNYEGVDVSIRKQSISIQDIFKSSPAMDKMLKEDYNSFMELPDAPDLSYGNYKEAITYTRSFDYKSIEDSQLSKEFWTGLVIGTVIVVASFVCPPAGIALGIACGTLELGSAASGRDWLTQRELGNGERIMRGTFALFDIIPGVRAFGASMHTARVATGTLGQADNVLQVMGKCTLQRTKNFAGQMGRASRRTGAFGKLLVSNTDEVAQLFITKSKGIGNWALSAGRSSIDDLGRKYKDLTLKGKKVLSGNFDDIKRYMKSLVPGDYVLVATPNGSVFRVAKSELGESSAELVARDNAVHAMTGIKNPDVAKTRKSPLNREQQHVYDAMRKEGLPAADVYKKVTGRNPLKPDVISDESARYNTYWLNIYSENYGDVVNSNEPWKWRDIPGGDKLKAKDKLAIKRRAAERELIPSVEMKPGTRYADFQGAGVVQRTEQLPEHLWKAKDREQFQYLDDLIDGRPLGTTWNHSEVSATMELVPFGIHNVTNHMGGRSKSHWAHATR